MEEKERAREEMRAGGNEYEFLRRLDDCTTVTYQVADRGTYALARWQYTRLLGDEEAEDVFERHRAKQFPDRTAALTYLVDEAWDDPLDPNFNP